MSSPPTSHDTVLTSEYHCQCFDDLLYKYDSDETRRLNCPGCSQKVRLKQFH